MTTIYARAQDQVLTATILPKLACNNRKSVKLHVDFDSVWDGYAKSALFFTDKDPTVYPEVLSSLGECTIPHEVLAEPGRLFITIQGINSSTGQLKSTTPISHKILPGTPSLVVSDPSPSVYEQLVTKAKVLETRLNIAETGATVDSEVQGIRAGADGIEYPSAGDAVRIQLDKKADKTALNRFLHNDVFSTLDVAHEIGDVICNYQGGAWKNTTSNTFTLTEGTYTLIIPKLDIPNIGNICLEYEGGVTDAKLRIVSATKPGVYQFYQPSEKVDSPILFRVRVSNESEPEHREYGAYSLVIVNGDTTQNAIIPDYLTNYSQFLKGKVSAIYGKNLFDKKSSNILYGYYLNVNNTVLANENICVTDFMPVEPNTSYVASGYIVQASYVHFFGDEKQYIGCVQGYDITNNCITTPDNCYFVKWSVGIDKTDAFQLEKGTMATTYEPFTDYQPTIILEGKVADLEKKVDALVVTNSNSFKATCDTLSEGEIITVVERADVKKNKTYVFSAQISDSINIRLGHGETEYGASYLDITNATITAYNVTTGASKVFSSAHRLSIEGFITVVVKVGIKASVAIFTANGNYQSDEFDWSGCNGAVFAKNNGPALSNCSYSVTFGDINSPTWIFGDSYLGLTNEARHPYYLLEMGFDDWLACGFPGGGASQELESLERLLQLGKPKYVVWCLGMNNGDNGVVNQTWLAATESVISMCEKNGIDVILATIPGCGVYENDTNPIVTVDNSYKNEWVKSSGFRYIDFEKAVVKNSSDGWYDGMLSGDGIHPTTLGAKALAGRLIADFPEITVGKGNGPSNSEEIDGVEEELQMINEGGVE